MKNIQIDQKIKKKPFCTRVFYEYGLQLSMKAPICGCKFSPLRSWTILHLQNNQHLRLRPKVSRAHDEWGGGFGRRTSDAKVRILERNSVQSVLEFLQEVWNECLVKMGDYLQDQIGPHLQEMAGPFFVLWDEFCGFISHFIG